jgi:tetratricopeptide (TPR) repeat protein
MRGQTKNALGRVEEAIANLDAAIRINPEDAEVYLKRGLARKTLRQLALAKNDLKCAQSLAQKQGLAELSLFISRELDQLNEEPFKVEPHSSEYVPGVDPDNLKYLLHDLDDALFIRKSAK